MLLFLIGCFCIVRTEGLNHWLENHTTLEEGFTALGHALLIASILAGSVDGYAKGRLLKEAMHSMSKYLIGWELPGELQDRIKNIMGTGLVRRNFHIHYKISLIELDPNHVTLTVKMEYEVENLTHQKQRYRQTLTLEKHLRAEVLEMRCNSQDVASQYYKSNHLDRLEQEIDAKTKIIGAYGNDIQLLPKRHGLKYNFSHTYTCQMEIEDSDIFIFAGPAINASITVECPDEIEFVANSSERMSENRWDYDRSFLAGEHLTVRWFRR